MLQRMRAGFDLITVLYSSCPFEFFLPDQFSFEFPNKHQQIKREKKGEQLTQPRRLLPTMRKPNILNPTFTNVTFVLHLHPIHDPFLLFDAGMLESFVPCAPAGAEP